MNKKKIIMIWNAIRKKGLTIFEKEGLDPSLEYISNLKVPANLKSGLRGEILFFNQYYSTLQLEALLDAGIKADFTGFENNKPVNYDVTTNLAYKNIDDYLEIMQKKKKPYSIALVNLKTEEIDMFPLKFPICPDCGKFSHYILYKAAPEDFKYHGKTSYLSNEQKIFHYCQECLFQKELFQLKDFPKFYFGLYSHFENETWPNGSPKYSAKEISELISIEMKEEIQLCEKESGLIISALAEEGWASHVGGPWLYVTWTHPLIGNVEIEHLSESVFP